MTGSIRWKLLGPVEVQRHEHSLDLGGTKPHGLLAMLLLARNLPVSASALIDGLWGDDPPATAGKMVHVYVSRIRHHLGDAADCLSTVPTGYLLQVEPGTVDLFCFEQLQQRATAEMSDDPRAAAALLREALDLWRGPALANVRTEAFATAAAVRLEELRLAALEARIDADLALGHHRQVVAELQELVGSHPTREQFGAQLMLALYRCGRQAEALATAHTLRANLRDELGISPSPAVADLEVAILQQAPELDFHRRPRKAALAAMPTRLPRRRRRWVVALATAAIIAAGLVVALSTTRRQPPAGASGHVHVVGSSLLVLDGRGAVAVADVPLGGEPAQIEVSGDTAWVTNNTLRTVTGVRLTDARVQATYGVPTQPSALAVTGSDVWVGDAFTGLITRLFSETRRLSAPFFPDGQHPGLVPLAADDKHLYAALPDARVVALDVANLARSASTLLPDRADIMTDSPSVVCVGLFRSPAVDCLRKPDLAVSATMLLPTTALSIANTDSTAWALAGAPARLFRVAVDGDKRVTQTALPPGATAVAVSPDYVWVLFGAEGKLLRLPADGVGTNVTVDLGHPAASLTTWRKQVLVALV